MADLINSLKTFASYGTPNVSLGKHSASGSRKSNIFLCTYSHKTQIQMVTNLIRKILPINRSGQNLDRSARDDSLMVLGRNDSCNESGFNQWRDAMRMVARLPGGLPPEFRIRLWENLADRYLQEHGIEWSRIGNKCRVENSRDVEIIEQIHKDLHRTGCRGFSGAKQAVLKQVLVSYARWNPAVGYCQGFNMIGAMLLQMTNGDEKLTLKILIFLIEGVLPDGYFSPGLRGLAIDMAVFRDILKLRKPSLNAHLSQLQKRDDSPPLTDVFIMHWFLTLFIHCLPTASVLRIWDLILLEGSEVLLRTSLVLWATIETRILCVTSTDEFYSVMGVVTRELLEFGLMDPNSLVKCIVSVGPFPFPGLEDLRQKHRTLISQDTPHRSFFLAKKELDSLKRHYASIRHRQRASTIILKGLNTQMREQRAALVVPTKRQVISPKPKMRRQISGKNSSINSPRNNGATSNVVRAKQVTVAWDKITKKPKTFRKRRTSASSHTTSSSSSTELCDSNSENENISDSAWIDSGNKKPTSEMDVVDIHEGNVTEFASETPVIVLPKSPEDFQQCPPEENLLITLDNSECSSEGSKCIDTNDSQHFLEEMSRLGKSDSFYGNLSQRICELQFQNLRILNTCNTVIDIQVSPRGDFDISPMPSPCTPMKSIRSNLEISKLAMLSPNQRSPRGSLSSNGGESPLPRSPLSSCSDQNFIGVECSRETSGTSNSSGEAQDDDGHEKSENNFLVASIPLCESSVSNVMSTITDSHISKNISMILHSAFVEPLPSKTQACEEKLEDITFNYATDSTEKSKHPNKEAKEKLTKNLHLDLSTLASSKFKSELIQNSTDTDINYISELEPRTCDRNTGIPEHFVSSQDTSNNGSPRKSDGQIVQTTEDVNAVIRENIAILQRLKLKPAYGDEEEDFDYFEYDSSDSNEFSDAEPCANGPESRRLNLKASFKTNYESNPKSRKSNTSTKSDCQGQSYKPKTHFNPFPTKRKSQLRTTKFGLYS